MKGVGKTLAASLGYLVCATLCLVHWRQPHWGALDRFAAGYFSLRFAGTLHSVLSSLTAFRSRPLREEWWGQSADPVGPRWVMLLMALDLFVFLDYGHWRFSSWLIQSVPQTAGLLLYFAVMIWQIWTDSYLARFFEGQKPAEPMKVGPYRYVRHPRYGAAIVGKIAMAMIFGSLFAWVLVMAWSLLLLKTIEAEEMHLRKLFGIAYELYARTTAKIIPGIY